MKPVLLIQHVAAEGPGAIGIELAAAGLDLDVRAVWRDGGVRAALPATLADYAALVIMGGPMAAHSDVGFPTRCQELELAREAIDRDLPTLGVCLGAQLIAVAAGGQCYRGPEPEIGWYPIRIAPPGPEDALLGGLPGFLNVFHWHGDTFSFPESGAEVSAGCGTDSGGDAALPVSRGRPVILASSDRYPNQAFRVGQHVWGLQCHPEVDEATVEAMVAAGGDELSAVGAIGAADREGGPVADPAVDTAAAILDATPAAVAQLRPAQRLIFGRFAALVRASLADAESS